MAMGTDIFHTLPAAQKHRRAALGRRVMLPDLGEERELRNLQGKLIAYWAAGAEARVIGYNPSYHQPYKLLTEHPKVVQWGFVVQVEEPGWGYFFINASEVTWLPKLPGDIIGTDAGYMPSTGLTDE